MERDKEFIFEKLPNGSLVRTLHDSAGRLLNKKSYCSDTVQNGVEEYYYPNGRVNKWKWFNRSNEHASAIVYFDTNGKYSGFKGFPFIRGGTGRNGSTYVEMINPPSVRFIMGYRDFYQGKMMRQTAYEPSLTDSTCWVMLESHKYEPGHSYFVYFYFLNDAKKIADSSFMELVP